MELNSVLNYLDDGIKRNDERLFDLEEHLKIYPSKSLQKKNVNGGIYYYLMYREGSKVKQDYVGAKSKIDLKNEKKKVKEYNENMQKAKSRYLELKDRNKKLKKVMSLILKIDHE